MTDFTEVKEFYDFPVNQLNQEQIGIAVNETGQTDDQHERIITTLISMVRNGTIWFPYQKFFRGTPEQLFANLKTIDLTVKTEQFKLHSYYPKYRSYLPPLFRGLPTVIWGSRGTYVTADVLSDHFIEDVRMRAKRYDQDMSIRECWNQDKCLRRIFEAALKKERINPGTLRDSIYETIPETKIFNPTWARALIKLVMGPDVKGKKWLDISSGWGDRLIAAMSLDMDYTGFDPNTDLTKGHSEMIKLFGDPNRHHIIYEPFEQATIPDGPYDVIMTSPPYFNLEDYAPGQVGQSIVTYPTFDMWMVWFLFAALEKAWKHLKIGGFLILHLGDARTIATSEATNIFIENYLQGSSWEGVLGVRGESGYPRPVWVWKKVSPTAQRHLWEPTKNKYPGTTNIALPSSQRTLYNTYPDLHSELIRFYAARYAPYYSIRRSNANAIRDHISINVQNKNISPSTINTLFTDIIISSLLETLSPDQTISLLSSESSNDINTINSLTIKYAPQYDIHLQNATNIRAHVADRLPHINPLLIDSILSDSLLFSSLLETLGAEGTITWAVAMIKFALNI